MTPGPCRVYAETTNDPKGTMIRIRAERLIAGDVILYGDSSSSSWRVLSIGKSTRPTKLDLLMEFVHGDDHRTSSLRATVERDRVFQATLLV